MKSQPFMAIGVCLGGARGGGRGHIRHHEGGAWRAVGDSYPPGSGPCPGDPAWSGLVWAAMVVSMILQGIFMLIRFRRGRWKDIDFAGQALTASR